jgi:hypothetical protein
MDGTVHTASLLRLLDPSVLSSLPPPAPTQVHQQSTAAPDPTDDPNREIDLGYLMTLVSYDPPQQASDPFQAMVSALSGRRGESR